MWAKASIFLTTVPSALVPGGTGAGSCRDRMEANDSVSRSAPTRRHRERRHHPAVRPLGAAARRHGRQAARQPGTPLRPASTSPAASTASRRFDYDDNDMSELSARCVLAGIPQYLTRLYQLANEAPRYLGPDNRRPGQLPVEKDLNEARDMLAHTLTDDAAVLLARAVWHPWLSAPFRHRRARKIRDLILRVFPSQRHGENEMRAFTLSNWERAHAAWGDWLNQAKEQRQGEHPR